MIGRSLATCVINIVLKFLSLYYVRYTCLGIIFIKTLYIITFSVYSNCPIENIIKLYSKYNIQNHFQTASRYM